VLAEAIVATALAKHGSGGNGGSDGGRVGLSRAPLSFALVYAPTRSTLAWSIDQKTNEPFNGF